MAFNPTLPANNAPIVSAELRNQFNGLHDGNAPVGGVMAWLKSFPNTPALPASWAECNGQVLDDPESVFHGATLPDLNVSQRFLRGAGTSGGTGGSESHTHGVDLNINGGSATQGADFVMVPPGSYSTAPASTLPSYYEVVWVMRVR